MTENALFWGMLVSSSRFADVMDQPDSMLELLLAIFAI
jgi:hypothetical protein